MRPIVVAVVFTLVSGWIETAVYAVMRFGLGSLTFLSPTIVWMAPVA